MSQRASGYERKSDEAYDTIEWPVVALLAHLRSKPARVWDPCEGAGRMVATLRAQGVDAIGTNDDFFAITASPAGVSHLITNPPYGENRRGELAVRFIEHALALKVPHIAMLLRVDFDSAKSRQHLFRRRETFAGKVVLLDRIKWFEGPSSPSDNHAWFLWSTAHVGSPTVNYITRAEAESKRSQPATITSHRSTCDMPVEPAHSPFGGSVAARVLRCPASVDLTRKVPAHLRKPSAYADRGTALHAAMALLLDETGRYSFGDVVGKTFGTYTVTPDDVANALQPAFAYVTALLDTPGAEFFLEARITFPTTAGAFGTADLIVRIGSTVHVVDLKFGVGVRVLALSPADDDPAVDVINSQLLFYAAAARHSLREFFAGADNVVLTIVQPVSIDVDAEMVSSVTVTHAELDAFIAAYRAACEDALSDAPHLERGSWCRFCPARPICPAHTGPLLDLTRFAAPPAPRETYLRLLAEGLNLVDAVKDIRTALHDQAKRALENGDQVPGYTLTAGRAERHWRDESAALAALQSLGFNHDDVMEAETMRSPKQLEQRAKARGLKIPQELIVSNRSGVSLVRVENAHAPVPGRVELARTFSEALEAFQEGGSYDEQRSRS
jgi:hypothetical protein